MCTSELLLLFGPFYNSVFVTNMCCFDNHVPAGGNDLGGKYNEQVVSSMCKSSSNRQTIGD